MSERTLVIIGAGIGGLAAGCTARQHGLRTILFEQHVTPGGLCTAWSRGGFTFDGSIHHLAGCRPGTPIYEMWEALGAMPRPVLFPDELTQIETPDGKAITIHTDLARLEAHLLETFPEDRREIGRYVRAVRSLVPYDLLELPLTGIGGLLRLLPALPRVIRSGRVTIGTAASRFRDPFLRRGFASVQYDWPDIPLLMHLNMLAQCSIENYGFPEGGSLPFARSIEEEYIRLGGEIHYRSPVASILTRGDRAIGVRLADGSEQPADAVISNAFAQSTVYELLGGRFVDRRVEARFARPVDAVTMGLQVSLGVALDLSREPRALVLLLDEPITIADQRLDRIPVELFGFDPSLAPEGKGVIRVLLNTSYSHWEALRSDSAAYAQAKERAAADVIGSLAPRFPGLEAHVEVIDVATPLTTQRFTGNGRGYASGGGDSMLDILLSRPRTLPGLRNVALVGQSAGGAGIPGCAAMGQNAARAAARQLGA